jgi:molybdopterin molybdotransferase
MIGFDEAAALAAGAGKPRGEERVQLAAASGRVLAEPVTARVASPRTDVSAMDGYAVRDADLAAFPARIEVAGESFAGRGFDGALPAGACVRIFTGAPVPAGADRVVIQENVRREADVAVIAEPPGGARHIRRQGSDFGLGEELVPAGRRLDPRALLAAAAADVAELVVHRQPRAWILGTGDELAPPGTAAGAEGKIPESVSYGVAALAAEWGAVVAGRSCVGDDLAGLERAAAEAVARADLVVVTGGASVGEKDFAKPMFAPLGLELVFSKVAIKPGKPVWLGRAGGALVLGLPGNPTSAMVTARLLLAPLLCGLSGRDPGEALRWRAAPLAGPLAACGERETFHRGRSAGSGVELLSNQDSGAQKGLAVADVLVRQRAGAPGLAAGDMVEVLDF